MSLRDAYQQKLQEQKAKLDILRARAKRAAAQGKILAYEELANADKSLTEAKARLKSLAESSGGAMSELKIGLNRAFLDLKTASKKAADHLSAHPAKPPPKKRAASKKVKTRPAAKTKPRRVRSVASAPRTKKH